MYFAEVQPQNVDVLKIDMTAREVLFRCPGWAIRHLLLVRDNYFGSFTGFTTRHEYFAKKAADAVGDPVELKYRQGKSNIFQVSLTLDCQDASILLPQELHDFQSAVLITIPELQLALSLHDYYMDLSFNTHPLRISALDDCTTVVSIESLPHFRGPSISLSGVDIVGNRLFGPQPRTSTYLCLWEIQLGQLRGNLSPVFLAALMAASSCFGINAKDVLNAPAAEFQIPLDPDVTFLKVQLNLVDVIFSAAQTAIRCTLPQGLEFTSNDLAGQQYQRVKSINVPLVQAQCLTNHESSRNEWLEVAAATFDLQLDIYDAPAGWRKKATQQLLFVTSQDAPTKRAHQENVKNPIR